MPVLPGNDSGITGDKARRKRNLLPRIVKQKNHSERSESDK